MIKKVRLKRPEELASIADPELPSVKEDFRKTFPWRIFKIMSEFIEGFEFVADFKKSVSIFGATTSLPDDRYYKEAEKLGRLLAKSGYAVITGGGPGIMEAANKGAYECGGEAVGINIQLPEGQRSNKFVNKAIGFYYFFTRKVMLSISSSIYVFFPGGYGTLDEFFEMSVLVQTKKISSKTKIIVVGKDYWMPLCNWIKEDIYEKRKAVKKTDLDIFKIVDSAEDAMKIIKN